MVKTKRTKEESRLLERAKARAMTNSLRAYFTGPGAPARIAKFMGWVALYGVFSASLILCYMSWIVISAIIYLPDGDGSLAGIRAWVIATPPSEMRQFVHGQAKFMLTESAQLGAVLGIAVAFWKIVSPAVANVKSQFTGDFNGRCKK